MTTPPRLVDRVTALIGSVDLSGFTPFFAPMMFLVNKIHWTTVILMVLLAAALSLSLPGYAAFGWLPVVRNSRLLRGAKRRLMDSELTVACNGSNP